MADRQYYFRQRQFDAFKTQDYQNGGFDVTFLFGDRVILIFFKRFILSMLWFLEALCSQIHVNWCFGTFQRNVF